MKSRNAVWGVLLGLALPGVALAQQAQTEVPGTNLLRYTRELTDPKWQAGMAEDIEVLRRLLAQKLRHGRASNGVVLWDADGGGSTVTAGTITLNGGGNLELSGPGPGTLTLGGTLNAAGREEPAPEGVYVKGHGVVYTVTLPATPREAKPKTDKPAAAPLSEWDRTRKELRGEKVEAPPAASEPPSLADVILKVLADNGRHFALLEPDEKITVVVTFRGEKPAPLVSLQQSPAPGGMPGMGMPMGGPPGGGGPIGGVGVPGGGSPGLGSFPGAGLPTIGGSGEGLPAGGIPTLGSGGPPTTAQDYVLLADLHLKQRQYEQALEAYTQAQKRQPDLANQSSDFRRKLAETYLGLNQVDQARAVLDQIVDGHQKRNRPAGSPTAAKPELPAKLIVSAPKKLLDQVGGGKMTFEEFKKAAAVDSFGGEK